MGLVTHDRGSMFSRLTCDILVLNTTFDPDPIEPDLPRVKSSALLKKAVPTYKFFGEQYVGCPHFVAQGLNVHASRVLPSNGSLSTTTYSESASVVFAPKVAASSISTSRLSAMAGWGFPANV